MTLILYYSFIVLLVALGFDYQSYRIPNWLTIPTMGAGLLWHLVTNGASGGKDALLGMAIPLLSLGWLSVFRVLGAGDVKLLAARGSLIGPKVWQVMVLSILAGGIISLIRMIRYHSLVDRIHYFLTYLRAVTASGHMIPYMSGFEEGKTEHTIHFSVGICIGFLLYVGKAGVYLFEKL